jgi:hypothetical protein
MTDDEIWALALKCGMRAESWMTNPPKFSGLWTEKEAVYRFAALVRRDALEEAAQAMKGMDEPGGDFMDGETCAAAIRALINGPKPS